MAEQLPEWRGASPEYRRARKQRVAERYGSCSCGSPVAVIKTLQCGACYQVDYRARLRQLRETAREQEIAALVGRWPRRRRTHEEHLAWARANWRARMSDPVKRARRRDAELAHEQQPEVRERLRAYKREWRAKRRAADPEWAEQQRAIARLRSQRYRREHPPKPPLSAEERELRRRQRRLEYEQRLIDDPEFRQQALVKEREQTKKQERSQSRRWHTDPEYRKRRVAANKARLKRRLATDPEYAARYRAQRNKQERERCARRRAERREHSWQGQS